MNFSQLSRNFSCLYFLLAAAALPVKADLIELTNGDHYRGTVISMNQTQVEFQSDIQGRVTLPRDKVAQHQLHEVAAKPVVIIKPAATVQLLIISGVNNTVPPTNQTECRGAAIAPARGGPEID